MIFWYSSVGLFRLVAILLKQTFKSSLLSVFFGQVCCYCAKTQRSCFDRLDYQCSLVRCVAAVLTHRGRVLIVLTISVLWSGVLLLY